MRRPSRSLIWLEKMISAMPLVNPVTTGCGMNLMALPEPTDTEPDQDDTGHDRRDDEAVDPVLLDDAVDDDHERTRWVPPIWTRDPPSTLIRKPAMIAV
jgi:hypothetical protein